MQKSSHEKARENTIVESETNVSARPEKDAYSTKKRADTLFIVSFLAYPMLLFIVFYVYVNFSSILLAFKQYDFSGNYTWVAFENFKEFISNITGASDKWATGLVNSLKMYILCLVICMPLYILFSYILFKKCPLHKTLRTIVMIPQIVSGFIISMVFLKVIEGPIPDLMKTITGNEDFPNLLYDSEYAFGTTIFYMIWISFSTSLIVYPNAMNEIDDSILEAAQLDGVGNMFHELWYIILPQIFPTISTFLITGFAGIFTNSGVLPTFYMYSAPDCVVNIGYLYWGEIAYATQFSGFPMLAAGGLLMTIIVAPLTILLRYVLEKINPVADC